MLEIKEYVKVESLEQAFELNQKRTNQIIGGMLWMKMGDHRIQTAIDLSGLGLDTIEEDETQFSIGCMTSLRQLELHEGLNQWSDGAVRESVRHIVGVQFRNDLIYSGIRTLRCQTDTDQKFPCLIIIQGTVRIRIFFF